MTLEAKPNFRALGKRFGKKTPLAAQAVAAFTQRAAASRSSTASRWRRRWTASRTSSTPDDLTIVRRASGRLVVQEEDGFFAAIDPTVTPELRREGMARELISRVQRMRKDAGLRGERPHPSRRSTADAEVAGGGRRTYETWIAERSARDRASRSVASRRREQLAQCRPSISTGSRSALPSPRSE